ncbi:Glycosyl transferase group 1 [Syntrophobacter sp. SbD1]|nr:Glycosyl transferase group 1 [Syntrophobacter sp. SbD1]
MIRVAWILVNDPAWIGGLNYFRNLMEALLAFRDRLIEPVVVGNPADLPSPLNLCPSIPRPTLPRLWPARMRDSIDRKILHNGGYFSKSLMKNEIRLLSHAQWLGLNSPVPAMCWIADFQHRRLPEFFSTEEQNSRNSIHAAMAVNAQAILLSSQDARRDFCYFHPEAVKKTYVLPFVAHLPDAAVLPPADTLLKHYAIAEPFFHVPNQLWAHKNHGVIVEALRMLAARGRCPLVVSTGLTEDYRNPAYFSSISKRLDEIHLTDRFRFLGVVPYNHMAVLMRSSLAVINPSLFEGWSTTVEESKSLGKRLLLSNIAVHREQAPGRSLYFEPHDQEALAAHILEVLEAFDPDRERDELERAARALPERMQQFARAYQEIVLDVIARHKG